MDEPTPKIVSFKGFVPTIPTEVIAEKIVLLGEKMAEIRLYSYQREFCQRIAETLLMREGRDITILVARQAGKSRGLATIVSSLAVIVPALAKMPEFENDPRFNLTDELGNYRGFGLGIRVGIYAPKFEQATIIFGLVGGVYETDTSTEMLEELDLKIETWSGTTKRFSNGSIIRAETASENSKIEGDTYHLIVTDESQDISDEKMEKSLTPMLAATAGSFIKVGTANVRASHFYHSVRRNRSETAQSGARSHFEYDWVVAAAENSLYIRHINNEKIRVGEHSDYFQQSYCCRFLLDRGMFITERLLGDPEIALTEPSMPFSHRMRRPLKKPWSVVIGVDFAKEKDTTVATAMAVNWNAPILEQSTQTLETLVEFSAYEKHVIDWCEILGDDYETQFHELMDYFDKFGTSLRKILVDATGLGNVLLDRYVCAFDGRDVFVDGYVFSPKTKSELFKRLHVELSGRRLTYPNAPDIQRTPEVQRFRVQCLGLQKEYRNGYMNCYAAGQDAHDDYPVSLALATWAAESPVDTMMVEASHNIFLGR